MHKDRDVWWHEEMLGASEKFNAETMDSEDPLFILYTSGSTETKRNPSYYSWIYGIYSIYF